MLVLSFALALFARSHLDPRPYYYYSTIADFTTSIIWLTPALLVIMAALGLYRKNIFMSRSRMPEVGRLFLASILNISAIITYG